MPLRSLLRALAAVAVLGGVLAAQSTDGGSSDALSRRAADRLRSLHDEADRLATEERTVLSELRRLEVERQIRTEELGSAQRDLATVTARIAELDAQIGDLEQQNQDDAPVLRARLVNLYKLGSGRYTRLLLSTSDVKHLAEASRLVAAMASQDRDRAAAHQRRIDDLVASRAALEQQRVRMASLSAAAARARAATEAALEARNTLITQIDQRRDLNAQLAGELVSAQQKLQSTLTDLGSAPAAPAPSLPIGPFRGDLEWPVNGLLRQRFGASLEGRAAPSNGIDLAVAEGTTVLAVHDGTVAYADAFAGFGRLVILDHGNQAFSLYGNLGDIAVRLGGHVQRGATVGSVGVSSTGAAGLYFELRVDGRPVDPVQWLRKK